METLIPEQFKAYAPQLLGLIILTFVIKALIGLPAWMQKLQVWQKFCNSHIQFGLEAGQGKYKWLEDPWSKGRSYWLCRHETIKHIFSRAAISEADHRAGFDWFHYAGWEIPTMDPRYRDTVRSADQTVHNKLVKSKLNILLEKVKDIGFNEIERFKMNVGPEGRVVSLHTLLYRLGYNVNCIGIFGPDLDHVATRVTLQEFAENMAYLFTTFGWPLPLWFSAAIIPAARRTVQARKKLYKHLINWYNSGGIASASQEMKAVIQVFEDAKTGSDVSAKFMNMMMIAFLANTPETIGWLFLHITQAPELFKAIKAECDALGDDYSPVSANFKEATPHLYSAFFETFRLYVHTGTGATIIKTCTLPGMGDHVFQPGDSVHALGGSCGLNIAIFGEDAAIWKGHRFLGEGESLLKYDLTFGLGRSPCPGRNFAIAELCTLAVRLIQTFDFSNQSVTERLRFEDEDWKVGPPKPVKMVDIIDLDGRIKSIVHPDNGSDSGPPGITAVNMPLHEFACKLTPRS